MIMNEKLRLACEAYRGGEDLRRRRGRCKDFTYGRQWGEPVVDCDGRMVTEGELAMRSGRQPLTNNLTRQLVKSVVGRWWHDLKGSRGEGYVASEVSSRNCLDELDARALEEFLISGCCIQRVVCERRPGGAGVWVDNVSPGSFFCNRFCDPRGGDIELVGMLHDMSLREVLLRWSGGDAGRAERLRQVYGREWTAMADGVGCEVSDFFRAGPGRCRVIEVWTLEARSLMQCHDRDSGELFLADDCDGNRRCLEAVNRDRAEGGRGDVVAVPRMTLRWHCTWLAPDGTVLSEYDSPYGHCSHPFVVKFHPMTDGEVHSLVEDVIDQQRYVNRLVTLVDHVMSYSAKGVLLFPVETLPEGFTWDDVRYQWSRPDGIVPYTSESVHKPEQVVARADNAGASELLALEMKMMEQVSGVSNALQGRLPQTITSADALRDSIENATVALLDIYETFAAFRRRRDEVVSQTIYNH